MIKLIGLIHMYLLVRFLISLQFLNFSIQVLTAYCDTALVFGPDTVEEVPVYYPKENLFYRFRKYLFMFISGVETSHKSHSL